MSLIFLPIGRLPRPLSGYNRLAIFLCVLFVGAGAIMAGMGIAALVAQIKGWEIVTILVGGFGLVAWAFGRALFWLMTGK